jgi:hypothetical protein
MRFFFKLPSFSYDTTRLSDLNFAAFHNCDKARIVLSRPAHQSQLYVTVRKIGSLYDLACLPKFIRGPTFINLSRYFSSQGVAYPKARRESANSCLEVNQLLI